MQYAIIENDTIINVAEADTPLAENWEPLQEGAGIGWARTDAGAPFEAPFVEPTQPDTRITKLAFRNRFTSAEKIAIEFACLDDPAAPMPQRLQSAALRANQADLAAATFVDLAREDTRAGVQMLEAADLLAEGRALVILGAEITPEERPL